MYKIICATWSFTCYIAIKQHCIKGSFDSSERGKKVDLHTSDYSLFSPSREAL